MANSILDLFASATAITITLGGLGNGSARQGTIVDNTTTKLPLILLPVSIKLGTSPTASTLVSFFLIRDDGTGSPIRTDGAGASDAGITVKNAQVIGTLSTGTSPSTGDVLEDVFVIRRPGPKWTIALLNGTGVALDATNGNHVIEYIGDNPQIQ